MESHKRGSAVAIVLLIVAHATLILATNSTNITNSNNNIPNQSQLCKTDAEIDTLRQSYGLIQVIATPTHAALHPGWPETVFGLALTIYSILTASIETPHWGPWAILFKVGVPFAQSVMWTTSFAVAEQNMNSSGWIAVSTIPSITTESSFGGIFLDGEGDDVDFTTSSWANGALNFMVFLTVGLTVVQMLGSLAVVGQRWGFIGFASVAYNISDAQGCVPYNDDFSFLQQGYRSRSFKILQTVQYCWILVAAVAAGMAADDVKEYKKRGRKTKSTKTTRDWPVWKQRFYAVACFMIIPSLIYEAVIATQGRPVKISGNCMLVELDPIYGFLDTNIDNWWKVLVSLTGL